VAVTSAEEAAGVGGPGSPVAVLRPGQQQSRGGCGATAASPCPFFSALQQG